MVSRITQLTVIDMIYSLLLSKDINNTILALEETMAAAHHGVEGAALTLP
jgi:hypothetical protein